MAEPEPADTFDFPGDPSDFALPAEPKKPFIMFACFSSGFLEVSLEVSPDRFAEIPAGDAANAAPAAVADDEAADDVALLELAERFAEALARFTAAAVILPASASPSFSAALEASSNAESLTFRACCRADGKDLASAAAAARAAAASANSFAARRLAASDCETAVEASSADDDEEDRLCLLCSATSFALSSARTAFASATTSFAIDEMSDDSALIDRKSAAIAALSPEAELTDDDDIEMAS